MFSLVEMEIIVFITNNTGVTTSMLSLHRNSQGAPPDSLRTVSGGLSKTGALVTPDLVVSGGRDPVSSSRDEVLSSGRDKVMSSRRDMISSGRDRISSGRDRISSGRDRINSGRASQGRV